ncbi:glycoside hydrolase family 68 protein [Sphingomonas soli]|uniref:glycoside hydrolase family 68 protein n=1 Tax=Sphingomonas soli TaxID=266127 RepID=UPI000A584103|nr:glycoside hydrolase family 68 protein [Sphingomonas soli]
MTQPHLFTDRIVAATAPSVWTAAQLRGIAGGHDSAPLIGAQHVVRVSPDLDIWDAWPIQDADGAPSALPSGEALWMALGAPRFPDPDERHGHARIHLLSHGPHGWQHLGPALADGFSPGSREWSGSAVLGKDRTSLTLFFTATGRRGEATLTFEQRLFRAEANLVQTGSGYRLVNWRALSEIARRDPAHYMASDAGSGAVGTIKAYRDPAYFRDPRDGSHHIFFAASLAGSDSAFNGVVGTAVARDPSLEKWEIRPPVISADTLNNELERPHAIFHQGLYYLFWSTQSHVFNPGGPIGPTGLYGMVAEALEGPWRPLNGTGLVFANPAAAPKQAYSWLVLPDLQVTSFIDAWGSDGADANAKRFGATFAPMLRLRLDGDSAGLAQ